MLKQENLYVKIIKWGIFLCVFTPLVLYPQVLSIFHFPKVVIFRVIVEIMFVFYILLILGSPKYRPKWNILLIAITVFTGLYVLTSLTGINSYRSFWGTLERMGGVFTFLHYWVFFVILISVFKSKQDWLKLLKLGVVAGFLSILYAWGQYFNIEWFVGWQRTNMIGTVGNAALFAGYLIFVLFLSIYLFIETHRDIQRHHRNAQTVFYGLVLVLGVPALFLTDVRGSIISFLGALFLLGLYTTFTSKDSKTKKKSIAFIILLIIIVSFFWFSRNQDWVQNNSYLRRITDISLQTETVQTRIWAWKSAWQGWKERLVLGWGPENFNVLFATHFDPRHYKGFGSEVVWDRAHNVLLNTGATMGIIGLLSYVSIFVVLTYYFIRAFRKKIVKKLTLGIFGVMLIAYVGHNMFIFDSFNSYLMFFIVVGYIAHYYRKHRNTTESTDIDKIVRHRRLFAIILIPIVIFTIWKTAVLPIRANYASTRGIVYGRSEKHFSTAFDYFRKSLSFNAIQAEYEIRHHLARLVFRVFSKTDNPQELGVGEEDIKFAISEIHKNIKTDPLDYIPHLYAARLNVFLSRISEADKGEERLNKAEEFLNTAKSLNEKNPYIYFELGQVRIFQNRLEQAIEFFNQGTLFNPEVSLGYWYAGVTYLDMGEIEKGEENINKAIEKGYKKNVSNIRRLLKIYVQLKDYPKIIELYLEALGLEPKNAQFYASLATAYKENGEIDKAIEAARRVGELDSKLKPEADAWIRILEREYK